MQCDELARGSAVMVSAGFVHLLGAAIVDLNPNAVFPVAPFLCGLGFILTLVADHTAESLSRMPPPNTCISLPLSCTPLLTLISSLHG